MTETIPGYTYDDAALPAAPIGPEELEKIEQSALFGPEDVAALRKMRELVADQIEEILDVWYDFVGKNPHLLASFLRKGDGEADADYLARVRRRFGRWILDTTGRDYDARWLAYQIEIGRRHHRSGKNRTDGVDCAEHVPFRYLLPLVYPIFATIRPFLERRCADAAEVDRMQHAWLKSLLIQVTLWSHPYVRDGDF